MVSYEPKPKKKKNLLMLYEFQLKKDDLNRIPVTDIYLK